MKQDLFVHEQNILSEFEFAYNNLMHKIVTWTICQSMKNLSTDHDSGIRLHNEILKSESANPGILIALKYVNQTFEGEVKH